MVLIDTGTTVGHHPQLCIRRSDAAIWNLELAAQAAAFNAAQPGAPCEDVDAAARRYRKGRLGSRLRGPRLTAQNGPRYRT